MAGLKIYHLFLLIILTQNILGQQPAQYSKEMLKELEEMKTSPNLTQRFKYLIIENIEFLPQTYISNAVIATQNLLKDESLQSSTKPEVIEFKKNLTQYLDKYAPSMDNPIQTSYEAMVDFEKMINQYYEHFEKETGPEYEYIIELLNKHNCKDIALKMSNLYEKFFLDVSKMLEENKDNMEKPLADWYEEFLKATYFSQKLSLIVNFLLTE